METISRARLPPPLSAAERSRDSRRVLQLGPVLMPPGHPALLPPCWAGPWGMEWRQPPWKGPKFCQRCSEGPSPSVLTVPPTLPLHPVGPTGFFPSRWRPPPRAMRPYPHSTANNGTQSGDSFQGRGRAAEPGATHRSVLLGSTLGNAPPWTP